MDTLTIRDLELRTHIGVPDSERASEQKILVTIGLQLDTKSSAKRDEPSIDYDHVVAALKELAKTERKTIERFAEDAATIILEKFHPESVTVTIIKFAIPGSKQVELMITRP